MLHTDCMSVLGASDAETLCAIVVAFARRMNFDRTAMTVVDHPTRTEFVSVHNAPPAYIASYADPAMGRADPVMQHCKCSNLPIIWNQRTYAAEGKGWKWEHQAPFGYAAGIAVALHLPGGRHFFLGVDRDKDVTLHPGERARLLADIQLFAVYAQDAALRVLRPQELVGAEFQRLTRREIECLQWTVDGKTAWELGRILGISENTAVRHMFNASRKLGCSGKHQAAVRALRLGLIY